MEAPLENPILSSVQSLSCVLLSATPQTAERQASLSITNAQSLLRLMSIESVIPSNYLIFCHPLLLLPSIFQILQTHKLKLGRIKSSFQVSDSL